MQKKNIACRCDGKKCIKSWWQSEQIRQCRNTSTGFRKEEEFEQRVKFGAKMCSVKLCVVRLRGSSAVVKFSSCLVSRKSYKGLTEQQRWAWFEWRVWLDRSVSPGRHRGEQNTLSCPWQTPCSVLYVEYDVSGRHRRVQDDTNCTWACSALYQLEQHQAATSTLTQACYSLSLG